mmetsp:Transcript_4408/g.9774  ORF Transcript_4408/g.9774 Transcript_4408/m.9774 type:complete len:89 (+) Transcript_4408:265-531(+)
MEWDGVSDDRPGWMRQRDIIPCDCKKCFFCIKGLSSGIEHKRKKQKVTINYKTNSVTTSKCTDRVPLGPSGQYCKMCYRKQPDDLPKE